MDEILIKKDPNKSVPFIDILNIYITDIPVFSNKFISFKLKEKLQNTLLNELSNLIANSLQKDLEEFTLNNNDYLSFITNIQDIFTKKYPVLDRLIKIKVENFNNQIYNIVTRFENDLESINNTFFEDRESKSTHIKDILLNLGDGHNGENTTIIVLNDDSKIIYKPRNISSTNPYNLFLNWIGEKTNQQFQTYKIIDKKTYGWIEYVNENEVTSNTEVKEYYVQAGTILFISMILGSKDCHKENVISSGKNPVIIDHETIIQPELAVRSSWDESNGIPYCSVLESLLIILEDKSIQKELAGFGVRMPLYVNNIVKKIINSNTIDSKRVSRFEYVKQIERNIPKIGEEYQFAQDYKEFFIEGFSTMYDSFYSLMKDDENKKFICKLFKKLEIRHVWRPTFVYFRILKYLQNPEFVSNEETYKNKLYELLSKAYVSEEMQKYKFILESEMKQMLNGDIPIFNLDSNDHFLKNEKNVSIFKYNCIENIQERIKLLSEKHKQEQLKHINTWLNM